MWAVVPTEGICRANKSPTQSERRAEFVVATTATGVKHSFNLRVSIRKASYMITVIEGARECGLSYPPTKLAF